MPAAPKPSTVQRASQRDVGDEDADAGRIVDEPRELRDIFDQPSRNQDAGEIAGRREHLKHEESRYRRRKSEREVNDIRKRPLFERPPEGKCEEQRHGERNQNGAAGQVNAQPQRFPDFGTARELQPVIPGKAFAQEPGEARAVCSGIEQAKPDGQQREQNEQTEPDPSQGVLPQSTGRYISATGQGLRYGNRRKGESYIQGRAPEGLYPVWFPALVRTYGKACF
jgi:hypothetical protein